MIPPQVMYLSAQPRAASPRAWAQVPMAAACGACGAACGAATPPVAPMPRQVVSPRQPRQAPCQPCQPCQPQSQGCQVHPTVYEASGYLRSEVPTARGEDAMHHTVSGRALPLARPLQPRPSPRLEAAAPVAEAAEAPSVSSCMVQQPRPDRLQESFAANSMCAGDISTQVRTLIGEQLKVLEDRLKTEILPKAVPAAKLPLVELPPAKVTEVTARAERLEEKLLQQFHRVKQEGERLKSGPKQSGDDPPPAPAESEGDPQQRDAEGAVKELTIGFRRLAEELQMQMGRVERRLDDLEEDVRSLKVQVKEKAEPPRFDSGATLEKRMDGMQEMVRSLEDGLRSWQSRTQQLDRWHQDHRSCAVTAPVTAVTEPPPTFPVTSPETSPETSPALESSPARPLSPRRMNEVKVTEHRDARDARDARDGDSPRHLRPPGASCASNGTATTVSYSKFMSLPPAYSPSDKDAMSDGDTRDFLELSAEVGLSLAVPQLGVEGVEGDPHGKEGDASSSSSGSHDRKAELQPETAEATAIAGAIGRNDGTGGEGS